MFKYIIFYVSMICYLFELLLKKSYGNYINEKSINFYKLIMHIRAQVVKKGRRRKRNIETNFNNFSEIDMILREFKYDFKNKNFL